MTNETYKVELTQEEIEIICHCIREEYRYAQKQMEKEDEIGETNSLVYNYYREYRRKMRKILRQLDIEFPF